MKYIIVVDKQSRTNPSSQKRETVIDIEELRRKGDVHDDFVIEKGIAKVHRRIGLTKYHVTYVLENEVVEELGELKIKLFKGDNYLYIKDEYNNNMCAEYVIDNEFNERYVTYLKMESAIEETARQIRLYVGQVLEGYSDTETTKAMIDIKADEIREEVSRDYASKDALEQEKSERVQTANSIVETVSATYSTKAETNQAKNDAINSANTATDNKLQNYSTTVQMNSTIEQKANLINLELNKKVNSEDVTAAKIMMMINNDESEILINGDKIDIDGKAVHFSTEITQTFGPYTQQDVDRVKKIIVGTITPTIADYEKYDTDGDGRIDSGDSLRLVKAVQTGNGYFTVKGTFIIDPYSAQKSVKIYRNNNNTNYPSAILSVLTNFFEEINVGTQINFTDNENGIDGLINSNGFHLWNRVTNGPSASFGIRAHNDQDGGYFDIGNSYGHVYGNIDATDGGTIILNKYYQTNENEMDQTIIRAAGTTINGRNVHSCKNLYNNISGTSGTVTLSETSANYAYIDITYAYGSVKTERVYNPNGKQVCLEHTHYENNTTIGYFKIMSINGTTISVNTSNIGGINTWNNTCNTDNVIKILKVDGYK